ncbi:hypothetical protein Q1695_010170 [Nippostrongylus brasiliensis]|nr:hypothetical protein Q1695_010170 [Nippostrongylus brasiliensis]
MNPKDPKMQAAKVRLLDGTHKDFELHRGSDGEALFVLVSADLSIEEREYFSLCFYDTEGIRHWLYNDKKILRQLKGLPWEFCFEVKFYPTVPSSLNDDHARYNLFLQLRNDVCSGRLPATIDTHATLGALVAQAQFGDAKQTPEYEEYLRTTKFAPQNSEQLLQMIAQKHKEYKGLTPAEAENLYMDTCKQQTMYGIFIFNAKDNKNVPVGIGICAHGIYIYKEQIRVNRFPWQGIIKISYRKNQFAVKLKAGEIDKKEATVVYKVSDYQHAKRIWKCAVEHHTFFRLIQPDEKPKSSLFRWGSARFRYQGRTQFQTKMASQMFDKPSTVAVQRTGSARLTHSLDNVAKDQAGSDQVSPLHYADNELGSREPMASPAATYEVSGQSEKRKLDDKVGNGLPSGDDDHDDDDGDELVYTPVESPTSAAYYLSERSSTYSPTTSNEFCRTQMGHTSYHSWQSATEGSAAGSAGRSRVRQHRENGWEGSSAGPSRPSTLSSSQMDSTDRRHDIEQLPINDSVQVYHAGHYNHLENQPRPPPRNNRGAHNQRNGVTSVQRLGPDAEMDIHPIRYFVSMQHSGTSHMPQVKRIRHPGREETGKANLSDYDFRLRDDTPLQRLEPGRELTSHNIRQYSAVYHPGSSVPNKRIDEVSPPTRLIARVLPSSSEREGRETAPGVGNPPLSSLFGGKRQKKAAREEVPSDSQRKQKSLQKMGKENVPHHTGTRQNLINGDDAGAVSPRSVNGSKFESSTTIIKTTTTKSEHKDPELHCSASTSTGSPLQRSSHVSDVPSATLRVSSEASGHSQSRHTDGGTNSPAANDETSRRTKETAVLHIKSTHIKEKSSLPAHDERTKVRLLDEGHLAAIPPHEHQNLDKQRSHYSPGLHASWKYGDRKQHKHNTELSAHGQSGKTVGAAEDVKHGQLSHNGMNEEENTTRSSELPSMPLREHTDVYHHGQSSDANNGVKATAGSALETARSKGKIAVLHLKEVTTKDKLSPSSEMEKGEVRLIAKVPHMPSVDEPDAFTAGKDHESFGKKENGSPGKFAFWKSGNRKQRGEHAEVSAYPATGKYAGPLDDVNRQSDIEQIPFTAPQPVAYNPAASTNTSEPSHRRTFLFGRWRHDGDEEVVEKDHVRPDTYGLASTSYEGPLENSNRSSELPSAPLREHSQAYHHGQSWNADKGVKETAGAAAEAVHTRAKTGVLHLKDATTKEKLSPSSEAEPREVRLIAKVPRNPSVDESDASTLKKDREALGKKDHEVSGRKEKESSGKKEHESSGKFAFWKSGNRKQRGEQAEVSAYPTTGKYAGPLDDVNRQSDIEQIPFTAPQPVAYNPAASTNTSEPSHRRTFLFGRWRHDGDEEVVEKDHVRPDTYGLASTSYEGPLENTNRSSELPSAPLREHSQAYHHEAVHTKAKTAVLHLKDATTKEKLSPSSEAEPREVRLIAKVPRKPSVDESDASTLKKDREALGKKDHEASGRKEKESSGKKEHESSGKFAFWKSGNRKQRGEQAEVSAYPATGKYAGPLDDVNRQSDIEQIPFTAPQPVAYNPAASSNTSEPSHRRTFLFGRWRHDGDEEVVEKDHVRPDTYGLASTSYEGPLENTNRSSELPSAPLREHSQAYHHGQSWDADKVVKETAAAAVEAVHTKAKTAVLHLKDATTKEKLSPTSEAEPREVRLIAKVPRKPSLDESDASTLKKDKESSGKKEHDSTGKFAFWKSGNRKQRGEQAEVSAYPTTGKYAGPLDDVNRQSDIEQIPFTAPQPVAYNPAASSNTSEPSHRRTFLFGRWRHDGDEEVVEKDHVRPDTYGLASTSYEGPLENTNRSSELPSAPLREHSQAYHHGQSWDADKGVKETAAAAVEAVHTKAKTAVLHLKDATTKEKLSPTSEAEPREVRLIAKVPRKPSVDESDASTLKKDREASGKKDKESSGKKEHESSGKFAFWKSGNRKQRGEHAEVSAYPATGKYAGPLDDVNRQSDIEQIPFTAPQPVAYNPAASSNTSEPSHRRTFLFGRWRHDGDEEVVEKDHVRPDTYGLASTSYEGPLENTNRSSELPSAPLREHSQAYHHGQSWDADKGVKETAAAAVEAVHTKAKTAVLHLKDATTKEKLSPSSEAEPREVRLIAKVPRKPSVDESDRGSWKEESDASTLKKDKESSGKKEHESTGKFAFWKSGNRKQRGEHAEVSAYPATGKYAGPLDDVNRQSDIEQIPFTAPQPVAYNPAASSNTSEPSHRRTFLFGRWRHDGDEEVVEKDHVRPDTYGLASTSYEGPLENTNRSSELPSAPLREHSQAYHHGQSWDADKGVKETAAAAVEAVHTKAKTAVLHLKDATTKEKLSPSSEAEPREVRLIAKVPRKPSLGESDASTLKKDREASGKKDKESSGKKEHESSGKFAFWKSGNRKQRGEHAEVSAYPATGKYAGPLDDVNRQSDIEQIPFTAPQPVAYNPAASTNTSEPSHRRTFLFGRWRHDGDEEVVEKDHVRPDTYGLASTSYEGPLENTNRSSELPSAPLREHSQAYHHGQSWDADKGVKETAAAAVEAVHTKAKTAVLHLKDATTKEKLSPTSEAEPREVRLIAKVPRKPSVDESDASTLKKESDVFWKVCFLEVNRKQRGEHAEVSAYPATGKYAGPLDDVNRQSDIEQIPFTAPQPVAYNPAASSNTSEPSHRRTFLFGRWRHDGDEEVVEKDHVRPDIYGLASTSYEGPLENTNRSSELPSAPLREHSQAYHHGQSWDADKGVKETAAAAVEAVHTKAKTAVLHEGCHLLKKDKESSGKKEHDSTGKFAFWKSGNRKQRGEQAEVSAYPTTGKYAGPLDDVNRQNDIEQIPFTAPQPVAYNPAALTNTSEPSHRRTFLFGRWRHDGDEEVVEKDHVRPDTYGLASTSYEGPLENTNRSSELPSAPLREHSQAYHHGQSWDADKGVMATAGAAVETVRTSAKATVLNLKPDVRLGRTSRSTVEIRSGELDGKDRLQNSDAATPLQSVASANVETPGQHSQSFFASRSDAGSVENAGFLAKDEYGKDEPSLSERVTKAESSRDGKRYSSRFGFWMWSRNKNKEKCDSQADSKSFLPGTAEDLSHPHFDSERLVAVSNSHSGRMEGRTMNGDEWVEVRVDRRVEVQLEPVYCLSGAGLGALSEDDDGMVFSVTPPMMPSDRSFFSRFGFKSSAKKSKKQKKGTKETDSSDSSSSSDDEKNQVHVMSVESGGVTLPLYVDPNEKDGRVVRRETNELKYRLKGEGISPGFDPENPSLASTMAEAERLNLRSPRLEHAERTVTVRAMAPLPLSYEESGQPHTTISTWQESSRLPDEVTTEYDEKGNKITRTLKTSQVKHTVQKQTFQNYVVPSEGQPGVVTVERVHEETTPLGTVVAATNGSAGSPHVVETHSRSVAYDAGQNDRQDEGLGEFVSCKTLTSGNRTVETYTYKTERDGIIETHVEHRVTIHSDEPIDHDAELSQAIMEATQMNPDMTVEKIEVRQESTA